MLSKIKNFLVTKTEHLKSPVRMEQVDQECQWCGFQLATMFNTPMRADLRPEKSPNTAVQMLKENRDGICQRCGLYQSYNRFTDDEVQRLNSFPKDLLTTVEGYTENQVTTEFLKNYNERSNEVRDFFVDKIKATNSEPKKILFLRHGFMQLPIDLHQEFGAQIHAIDPFEICSRLLVDRLPSAKTYKHKLTAPIDQLIIDNGPFDVVVAIHQLVHTNNLKQHMADLQAVLSPNGIIFMGDELKVAPHNPFHKLYPNMNILKTIVEHYFDEVQFETFNGVSIEEVGANYGDIYLLAKSRHNNR